MVKTGAMAMTNREWLRSLTDEELADFFIDDRRSLDGGICNICAHDYYCIYDEKLKCDNGIATWLKQEYKNDDNRRKGTKIRKPKRLQSDSKS